MKHWSRTENTGSRSEVNYAFFTGPKEFLVDVEGTKLRFRFTGFRWKLKRVELTLD